MSNPIFSLFASSPFLPMQEHMKKVLECVQTLEGFMLAVFDEDWEQAEEHQETINNLEEIADDLKR